MILGTPGISSGNIIPDWFFASILLTAFVIYQGFKLTVHILHQINADELKQE